MFGKSKPQKPRKRQTDGDENRPKPSLAQYGLLEIPNVSDLALGGIDDENDSDLEAELLALTGENPSNGAKKAKKVNKPGNLDKMVAACMKDSYDDEIFDEEDPDLLAELSALGPEEDEEDNSHSAASENVPVSSPVKHAPVIIRPSPFVAGGSVVSLLKERIEMYEEAEENALRSGDTSRVKRCSRGLKTLNQMMKSVNSGNTINEGDIPPAILMNSRSNSTADLAEVTIDAPTQNLSQSDLPSTIPQAVIFSEESAKKRQKEEDSSSTETSLNMSSPQKPLYPIIPDESPSPREVSLPNSPDKSSVLPSVHKSVPEIPISNNSCSPVNPNSISSQPLSSELSALLQRQQEYKLAALAAKKSGATEDALSYMRTAKQFEPLIQAAKEGQIVDFNSLPPPPGTQTEKVKNDPPVSADNSSKENPSTSATQLPNALNEVTLPSNSGAVVAPSNPASVVEALEQRLAKYTEQRDKSKAEENSRKQRMNERIMKQYQDAIRAHKMGRYVDFDELPTPPGFPPIPGARGPPSSAAPPGSDPVAPQPNTHRPAPAPPAADPNTQRPVAQVKPQAPQPPQPPIPPVRTNVRKNPQSMVERQLSVLKRRRDQFKSSALEAKKKGEIEQAKEYLRNYKGIEQLILTTEGGLPVDMNTVPIPPQETLGFENTSMDFEVVDKEDCIVAPQATDADMALTYAKLEEELIGQIKMCARTREHFKALGDVASSNRFEQLIIYTKKDLDAVRVAFKRGDTPPRFHYENRSFTMIQCNTDLNDSDCEVCILRGINFNVPNPTGVDTCVKIEFPYPSDAAPQERTDVVKDTNNPEFNHKVVFSIDRKARALSRVFKRHSVKCQVVAKGGWFHRDAVIGSIKIPLVALETKCTLHDSFDLIDEKKKMVGGKLEVKVRVRNPILSKQLEKVTEKWIVIDGF